MAACGVCADQSFHLILGLDLDFLARKKAQADDEYLLGCLDHYVQWLSDRSVEWFCDGRYP